MTKFDESSNLVTEEIQEGKMARFAHGVVRWFRVLVAVLLFVIVDIQGIVLGWFSSPIWISAGETVEFNHEALFHLFIMAFLLQLGGKIYIRGVFEGMIRDMGWSKRIKRLPVAIGIFAISVFICFAYLYMLNQANGNLLEVSMHDTSRDLPMLPSMTSMKLLIELTIPPLILSTITTMLGYLPNLEYFRKTVKFIKNYIPVFLVFLLLTNFISVLAGGLVNLLLRSIDASQNMAGYLFQMFNYTQNGLKGFSGVMMTVIGGVTSIGVYYSLAGLALTHYNDDTSATFREKLEELLKDPSSVFPMIMCVLSVVLSVVVLRSSDSFLLKAILFIVFGGAWLLNQYLFLKGTNLTAYAILVPLMHLVVILIPTSLFSLLPEGIAFAVSWVLRILLFSFAATTAPAEMYAYKEIIWMHIQMISLLASVKEITSRMKHYGIS